MFVGAPGGGGWWWRRLSPPAGRQDCTPQFSSGRSTQLEANRSPAHSSATCLPPGAAQLDQRCVVRLERGQAGPGVRPGQPGSTGLPGLQSCAPSSSGAECFTDVQSVLHCYLPGGSAAPAAPTVRPATLSSPHFHPATTAHSPPPPGPHIFLPLQLSLQRVFAFKHAFLFFVRRKV